MAATTCFWIFRITDVIDGWTFLLLFAPTLLLCPLIAEAKKKDLETEKIHPLELIGIDHSYTDQIVEDLNKELNLPFSHPKDFEDRSH